MKKIYQFTLHKEKTVEKTVTKLDEFGKEIRIIENVVEKEPHVYFIKKPGRSLIEESELFSASIVAECIKRGVVSAIILQKHYSNENGVLSENQKADYQKAYEDLLAKQLEQEQLNKKTDKTEEDKKRLDILLTEIIDIISRIQSFENNTSDFLYQNTAETIARNRTQLFWTLNLSYEDKDGKNVPVFGEGEYKDKLVVYDRMEENEDEYELSLIKRLYLATSLLFLGKAETQEDFDLLINIADKKDLINATNLIKVEDKAETEDKK